MESYMVRYEDVKPLPLLSMVSRYVGVMTVRVAGELVTLPAALDTTQRKVAPLSPLVCGGVV